LIAVESLHRAIAGHHDAHAFGEAARFLAGRRDHCRRASIDDARLRALAGAARELGGEELGCLAGEAVARLAAAPGLPEHGSLRTRNVLLCPGRTVLTGWERFAAAGPPGADALALGIDALPPGADAAGALTTRATVPELEPFWEEIADLGLTELADDVILLGLVALAEAEREAAAQLEPTRTAAHRITLEAWLGRHRARRTSVRGSVPAATLAANVSRPSPPST
jgi:hypothetical protein